MKTVCISFVEDAVNPFFKGVTIRIAHLLATQIRIAGNISSYAELEAYMRNISLEQKIKYVEQNERGNPTVEAFYKEYKHFQKIYKKDRGRDKELIVLKKQLEKAIINLFNIRLASTIDFVKTSGLLDLDTIAAASDYREYYIRYHIAETRESDCHRLSDALQLKLAEEDGYNHPILTLTDDFFSPEFAAVNDAMPAINAFSEQGFLQELFDYPNYNVLSITDLNTIRYAVANTLADFQQAVNEFAGLSAQPAEAFAYLQGNIVDIATRLATSMEETAVITNYKKVVTTNTYFGKLYLGMIPRSLVFKYFAHIKVSQEETNAVLEQLSQDDMKQLIPVLISSFSADTLTPNGEADTATPAMMPLKKSLSID